MTEPACKRSLFQGKTTAELRAMRRDFNHAANAHRAEAQRALAQANQISRALDGAQEAPVEVSDHAVIRWLERVEGVDVAAVRLAISEIVAGSDGDAADRIIPHGEFSICMIENRVTTVLDAGQRPKRNLAP